MRTTDVKRSNIRVFLVDDHPIVREGVRSYLINHSISVVGEASDAKEALRKVKKAAPDVIVLDVNLPSIDGGELARRLRLLIPKAKLIAFSIHSSEEYVVRMARCGVQGYVTKDQPRGTCLMPSRTCSRRRHFPVAWPPFFHFAKVFPDQLDNVVLTGRELEVLAARRWAL